jgi:hypothetical protein
MISHPIYLGPGCDRAGAQKHLTRIREEEANPIPRAEFSGNRINLAFYDLMDGANIATASHIKEVYRFSERWA